VSMDSGNLQEARAHGGKKSKKSAIEARPASTEMCQRGFGLRDTTSQF